jgi:hypothetical protein
VFLASIASKKGPVPKIDAVGNAEADQNYRDEAYGNDPRRARRLRSPVAACALKETPQRVRRHAFTRKPGTICRHYSQDSRRAARENAPQSIDNEIVRSRFRRAFD